MEERIIHVKESELKNLLKDVDRLIWACTQIRSDLDDASSWAYSIRGCVGEMLFNLQDLEDTKNE